MDDSGVYGPSNNLGSDGYLCLVHLILDQLHGVLAVIPGAVALAGGHDLVIVCAEPPRYSPLWSR
jgi:hypothetical protein